VKEDGPKHFQARAMRMLQKFGAIPWMKTFNKSNYMEEINAATEKH